MSYSVKKVVVTRDEEGKHKREITEVARVGFTFNFSWWVRWAGYEFKRDFSMKGSGYGLDPETGATFILT